MSRRPLIAFFAPVAPYPDPLYGGQIRVDRLLRQLLREFDVALVCETPTSEQELVSNWEIARSLVRVVAAPRRQLPESSYPEWGSLGASARAAFRAGIPGALPAFHSVLWSDDLVAMAHRLFNDLPVEGVWACRSWMAEMARAAGARRIHVDVDDFEGQLMRERVSRAGFYRRRPLHWLQAVHLDNYERRLPHRFQGVSVCKMEDLERFKPSATAFVRILPNGVDVPETLRPTSPEPFTMLFVGALWYAPNAEALGWFIRDVLPRVLRVLPGARLIVAGRGPVSPELGPLLGQPAIELHVSPQSVDELYTRASLAVAPLLTGGGTSIKVLESLANGVAIVASPVALRGLGLKPGAHAAVASSADEFARACVELLANPAMAANLAAAGRQEISRRLTWESVGAVAREAMYGVLQQ